MSLLHHAVGIGSLLLTVALVYEARSVSAPQVGFLLVVLALLPGYYALRYLRSWRAQR